MLAVAEHYYHYDGVSPINAQNRALIAALKSEFAASGIDLPIYWGNRNWHPMLEDTVGRMKAEQVTFPLKPVYDKKGIVFKQAKAVALHPEGKDGSPRGSVDIVWTQPERSGQEEDLEYDYVINATGPKLNFGATPGLGPDGHTVSVCTYGHATEAAQKLSRIRPATLGQASRIEGITPAALTALLLKIKTRPRQVA